MPFHVTSNVSSSGTRKPPPKAAVLFSFPFLPFLPVSSCSFSLLGPHLNFSDRVSLLALPSPVHKPFLFRSTFPCRLPCSHPLGHSYMKSAFPAHFVSLPSFYRSSFTEQVPGHKQTSNPIFVRHRQIDPISSCAIIGHNHRQLPLSTPNI